MRNDFISGRRQECLFSIYIVCLMILYDAIRLMKNLSRFMTILTVFINNESS